MPGRSLGQLDGRSVYFAGNRNADWMRDPEDWGRHTSMVLSIYRVEVADGALGATVA
jgi:hypothetical protein